MSTDGRIYHVTESRVSEIVNQAIDRNNARHDAELRGVITATVRESFMQLGIDTSDPKKMQRAFLHLEEWATTMEKVRSHSVLIIISAVITGILAMLVVGLKVFFGGER